MHSLDTQHFSYAFMDYRGYGARKGSGGPYTIAQIARMTRWRWPITWAGSVSAWSGIRWAAWPSSRCWPMRPIACAGAGRHHAGAGRRRAVRRRRLGLFLQRRARPGGAQGHHGPDHRQPSDRRLAGCDGASSLAALRCRGLRRLPHGLGQNRILVERIQGQTLPVLVVAGEHDPAVGAETCKATWLQHYPNARLEVMANAGHYPMDETPVALATVMEKFLRAALAA
jgi:pimeloyl-ACP methyl ester carboxylesterase